MADKVLTKEKKLARLAAANFSTNLMAAVNEFSLLAKESDLGIKPEEAPSMFLSLLEPYRYPMKDGLVEYMYFKDPDIESMSLFEGFHVPSFTERLNEAGVDTGLARDIENHLAEKERSILEKNKTEAYLESEHKLIEKARKAYDDPSHRNSSARKTAAIRALGLSKSGNPSRINHKKAWFRYVQLIREKAYSRESAVIGIIIEFDYGSYESAVRCMHYQRTELLNKWKEIDPKHYPQAIELLKGIVPQSSR